MGRELLQDEGIADLCRRSGEAAGVDLRHLLTDADEEELRLTQHAQPALTFVGIALAGLLRRRGIEPEAAAGHSVGEYAALAVAGALEVEDAVRAVAERGRAMADAAPAGTSTMAAVLGLDAAAVEAALAGIDGVWPANLNTPTQTVIAGRTDAVERAAEPLREAGARRVLPLNVSAAFHTELVAAAGRRLHEVLLDLQWRQPRIPVVRNVDAKPYESAGEIPDVLARQVASPVRWADCVASLRGLGVDTYVEVGPRRALTGMLKELDPHARAYSVGTPEEAAGLLLE